MQKNDKRILLVEDDRIEQMAFERFVREENFPFDYAIAGSVNEAGKILREDRFAAVVMDFILGDGTAFDLFNIVNGAPIIIVTGAGDEEVAVKAMKEGAYDYLIKDTKGIYFRTLNMPPISIIIFRKSSCSDPGLIFCLPALISSPVKTAIF